MSVLENILVGIGVSLVAGGILALLTYFLTNYHKFRSIGVFLSFRTLREQFNEKKNKRTKINKKLSHLIKGWREKFVHFPEREAQLLQALKSGENIRMIGEASRGKTRTIIECIRKLARDEQQFKHVRVVFITHNSSFEYKRPFRRLFLFKFPLLILFFDDIDKINTQINKTTLTLSKIITDFKQVAKKAQLLCTCRSKQWSLAGKTKVDKKDLLEAKEEIEHSFNKKVQLQPLNEEEGRKLASLYPDFDFPKKFSGNPGEIIFKTLTKRYEYDNLTEEYRKVLQAIKLAILGGIYSPSITLIQKISRGIFSVEENIGQILTDLHNSEFVTVIHENQVIDILDAYVDKVIHDFPININNLTQYLILLRKLLEEEKDAEKIFYLGKSFIVLADYKQAIETYFQALKIEEKAVTYSSRGIVYARQEKYEEAINDYTKAIELEPEYTKAYNNRGNAYTRQEKYEEAINDFSKAIALDPEYAQAYNSRGIAFSDKGEYEEAINDFSKAIALDPEDAQAYYNRGSVYYYKGEYEEAINDFSKAIALDPEDTQAYNNRGNAYTRQEKYEEAINDYTKAIALDPEDAQAYYNRGSVYYYKGEYEEAINDFSKAIALEPEDAQAYNNRGNAYTRQEKYKEAINDYTKAITLDPEDAQAYYNRGTVYTRQETYKEAINDYTKAIALDPEYALAYYNRGNAYAELNEIKNQLNDYYLAWKYRTNFPDKGIALIPSILSSLLEIYSEKKDLFLSHNLATELKLWIKRSGEFFEEYSPKDKEVINRTKELLDNLEKE